MGQRTANGAHLCSTVIITPDEAFQLDSGMITSWACRSNRGRPFYMPVVLSRALAAAVTFVPEKGASK
jgi:hypothetical protein